jgi:indolepyruvate ferredoxin oxidoreductase, beta subunit
VKGYGDTHERGWSSFSQISSLAPGLISEPEGAARLRALREAALADDNGAQLERAIASLRMHPPVAA